MNIPSLREEKKLWKNGFKRVAGIDEVGRGPLAGPVVAAAVLVKLDCQTKNQYRLFKGIKDSKKLSAKKREEFYKLIIKNSAIQWGIGKISEKVIDKINILEATKLAMEKAIENLEKKLKKQKYHNLYDRKKHSIVDFLILDGKIKLDVPLPQKAIIKADERVVSCALASIVAKVSRDRMMVGYHEIYPGYGFNFHKGYPTKRHLKMLRKHGPCLLHRKSFAPLKELC